MDFAVEQLIVAAALMVCDHAGLFVLMSTVADRQAFSDGAIRARAAIAPRARCFLHKIIFALFAHGTRPRAFAIDDTALAGRAGDLLALRHAWSGCIQPQARLARRTRERATQRHDGARRARRAVWGVAILTVVPGAVRTRRARI